MATLGWCYVAVLAATAAFAVCRCGWTWMPMAVALWAIQAASVAFGNTTSEAWLRTVWLPGELISMAATLLFAVVAVLAETAVIDRPRRFWLRFGALAIAVALPGLIWLSVRHNDTYWILVDLRARAWEGIAFALGITLALAGLSRDSMFLLAVAVAHSLIGPLVHHSGMREQSVSRVLIILACCWWMSRRARGSSPALTRVGS